MSTEYRLDEVCEVIMGQAPSGEAYNSDRIGWPLIAGAGDFGDGVPCAKKFTAEAPKLSKVGDVVLGIRASIGEKVVSDNVYCLGRGVAALRASERLSSRYLWHWLTDTNDLLVSKAKGATFKQVNRDDIGELKIALPPLAEQQRIANILDAADALRSKRRAAIEEVDSLSQAIFIEMFGDPHKNTGGWPTRTLKRLGTVKTGRTPSGESSGVFGGEVPFVTPGDLEKDGGSSKRTLTERGAEEVGTVRAGAALVCCIGATIGKMAKATHRSAFNQQINAVEWAREIDDSYGISALRFFKSQIANSGTSTTLPILKKSLFEAIQIPVPPLPLQQEFARRIAAVEALKAAHRASLAELDALFASLQHRAFRGEL